MSVARRQRTLARPVSVTGFGYFSGRDIRVEFWPAAEHAGITFVRHDIGPAARVPADAALRIDVPRRTTLELNGVRVEMVEHVLAALAGLRIDNCEVWVDAAEMPGCDGSAKAFVEAHRRGRRRGAAQPRAANRASGSRFASATNDSWIEAQPLAQCRALGLVRSRFRRAVRHRPADSSRSISRPIRFAANWRPAARSFREEAAQSMLVARHRQARHAAAIC